MRYSALGMLIAILCVWVLVLLAGDYAVAHPALYALNCVILSLILALHSSLSHEAVHGHIIRPRWLNDALVTPNLSLFLPYLRYKQTHIQHHECAALGQPGADPESFYVLPAYWRKLPLIGQLFHRFFSTFAGRLALGWLRMCFGGVASDIKACLSGDKPIIQAWALHIMAVIPVLMVILNSPWLSLPAYLIFCVVPASMLLTVRSYIEHRAEEENENRSVIVQSNWFFKLLFLNNNLHLVHHEKPQLPWYEVGRDFNQNRSYWQSLTGGYYFTGYGEVFRHFAMRAPRWLSPPIYPADHPNQTDKMQDTQ